MVSIVCADRQHVAEIDTLIPDISIWRNHKPTQNHLSKLVAGYGGLWRRDTKALLQDTNKVCGTTTMPKELRISLGKISVTQ